jgi:hypothetical protein
LCDKHDKYSHFHTFYFLAVVAGLYSTAIVASSLAIKKPWPGYHPGGWENSDGRGTATAEFNVRPEELLRTPQFYYLFASATLLATGQSVVFTVLFLGATFCRFFCFIQKMSPSSIWQKIAYNPLNKIFTLFVKICDIRLQESHSNCEKLKIRFSFFGMHD